MGQTPFENTHPFAPPKRGMICAMRKSCMNNIFRILAKPAKLAKVVTYGLCELRGLSVKNTL